MTVRWTKSTQPLLRHEEARLRRPRPRSQQSKPSKAAPGQEGEGKRRPDLHSLLNDPNGPFQYILRGFFLRPESEVNEPSFPLLPWHSMAVLDSEYPCPYVYSYAGALKRWWYEFGGQKIGNEHCPFTIGRDGWWTTAFMEVGVLSASLRERPLRV